MLILNETEITAREEMSNRYFEIPDFLTESSPYNYDQDFLVSDVSMLQ